MLADLNARIAPNGPGITPTWTTGAKDGLGTAYYDPTTGESKSNVWYTLARGVLTEVYYPNVSCANLRTLQFVVSDGQTFTELERTDTHHHIELVYRDALVYKQVNTSKTGRYKIEKTYAIHPDEHCLAIEVTFETLIGHLSDYQVYVYANPLLNNKGTGNSANVFPIDGSLFLTAYDGGTAFAIGSDTSFHQGSVGFVGVNDGLTQLKDAFCVHTQFDLAENGNVGLLGQIVWKQSHDDQGSITLVLGFGPTPLESVDVVRRVLGVPFSETLDCYRCAWADYVATLNPPLVGNTTQYLVAAMTLRAHEDKQYPGAIIASLTVPWGERVSAQDGGVGGYHLVWSRDFYQVASALCVIGDNRTAQRALDYLDGTQQRPDGSFPQNSWLDGTPYWNGIQLDEVALPILLAQLLDEWQRYRSLVKPAADFILRTGPYSPQERWEENAGYSPSTIAAQIAGLVVAAEFAKHHHDFGSAAAYLRRADEWAMNVDNWTTSSSGALSANPYYIRISDTKSPDDGHFIEIKNGGGWHPKANIVDGGFLELVRLGIKSADDETITNSVDVIDNAIRFNAAYGPVWYRYNHDGYGEHSDGQPYDGTGQGRPWPFLTGERGEYEIALRNSERRHTPSQSYEPEELLQVMESSANQGHLIPEQIWDGNPQPELFLHPGQGTGSATPLAWAMAQYIRLATCVGQNRIVEQPIVVRERYQTSPPPLGPCLVLYLADSLPLTSHSSFVVRGRTDPGATIVAIHRRGPAIQSATSGEDGTFELSIPLLHAGTNALEVLSYDNRLSVSWQSLMIHYRPHLWLSIANPTASVVGPGRYELPTHVDFKPGDFDLKQVSVSADARRIYFEITLGHLDNPWGGPSGLSKQLIDIYLRTDAETATQRETLGLPARFAEDSAWNRLIRVTGNWHSDSHIYNDDWTYGGPIEIYANAVDGTVVIAALIDDLGEMPSSDWGLCILLAGYDDGRIRPVRTTASEWAFGGARQNQSIPSIVDFLVPIGSTHLNEWRKCQEGYALTMVRFE